MINSILSEVQSQVKTCKSTNDYLQMLRGATLKLENASQKKIYNNDFENPLALVLIEVYILCPEAINQYAKENKNVTDVCERMFRHEEEFENAI